MSRNLARRKHVLLLAYTSAFWGGLQEYVVETTAAMIRAGVRVTVVVKSGQVAEGCAKSGAAVLPVDWEDLAGVAEKIAARGPYSVVFAQPFASRELGMAVANRLKLPVYVMFHGFAHDRAYLWWRDASGFIATSPAIGSMLTGFCKVPMQRVSISPNGLPDHEFSSPIRTLEERVSSDAVIAGAFRLEHDKVRTIDALSRTARWAATQRPDLAWSVRVYGDGRMRPDFERRLSRDTADLKNVRVEFRGWLEPTEVPTVFGRAVLTVGAGRAAAHSIAAGTPCVAAGAQEDIGQVTRLVLPAALHSNFGDYPVADDQRWVLDTRDAARWGTILTDQDAYESLATECRMELASQRTLSVVVDKLLRILGLSIRP